MATGKPGMLSRRQWLINLWYLLAIAVGLYFAWRQGAGVEALLFAAFGSACIVCVVLLCGLVMRWKRK